MLSLIIKCVQSLSVRIILSRLINATLIFLFLLAVGLDQIFWIAPLIVTLPLFILFESFLLSFFGVTPGNIICGIEVCSKSHGQIRFKETIQWFLFLRREATFIRFIPKKRPRKWAVFVITLFTACSLYFTIFDYSLIGNYNGYGKGKYATSWIEFAPSGGGFSVLFPTDPVAEMRAYPVPDSSKKLLLNEYKVDAGSKDIFSVSHLDVPSMWKLVGVKKILRSALDKFAEEQEILHIKKREFSHFQQYRSLEFTVQKGRAEISGMIFMKGNRVYLISCSNPDAREQFINSFTLTS